MATVDGCSGWSEATQPRIVVGVDGSPTSLRALEWAAGEARLRGATLEVVHVTFFRRDALELDSFAALKKRERPSSMGLSRKPGLGTGSHRCRPGRRSTGGRVLVDVSKDAHLLVVGSRGLGVFKEFALGSVSQDGRAGSMPAGHRQAGESDKGVVAGHA